MDDFAAELEDRYGPLPEPASHLCRAARLKALGARARLARLRVRPGEARAELRWPTGVEPKLKAIHEAAGERDVTVTVRNVDPLHLELVADDATTLFSALSAGLQAWSPEPIVTS